MLEYVDIDNILISSMVSSGKKNYKHLIGYKDEDYKITPLLKILPKKIAYIKSNDGDTKWMNFFIQDAELWKKYNDIWNNVSNGIKKNLDCEPISLIVNNTKFLKTKIRSYGAGPTDFHTRIKPEDL